jgi:hypothetical protein
MPMSNRSNIKMSKISRNKYANKMRMERMLRASNHKNRIEENK